MNSKEKGMEIDNDLDKEYLKGMFDHDGIKVPESLSKENIASMLADVETSADKHDACPEASENGAEKNGGADAPDSNEPVKKNVKKRSWRKALGLVAAAAACLLLVAVPALNAGKADAEELFTFKSYDEIYKTIDKIIDSNTSFYGERFYAVQEDADAAEGTDSAATEYSLKSAVPNAAKSAAGGKGGEEHSDTYLQVEGVDEADVVKVDGKYLYFIDSTRNRIMIYRADNGKAEKVSSIDAGSDMIYSDIFLNGDKLVAIGEIYTDYSNVRTAAEIYDISSRKEPVRTSEYVQSGSPVSQRMVGDILYLVTDQYAYDKVVPYCGSAEKTDKLKAGDISCLPSPVSPEYTVIGAVDTASGKELSHVTKAVLGGSQDIYSNGDNLYVAGTTYIKRKLSDQDGGPVRKYFMPFISGEPATMLVKVKMANGDISIQDSAIVKGTIDDQFSMDERDGKFRIATTSTTEQGDQVNNLFVLDKNLKELGHVSGFARGESIKAVRYVKDKAYVITYEQTDPLFIIDLSDSKAPKIEGAVKIDGFSTLLVPISENRMLGIGYGTKQVESWQETSGIKFALFDISDPSKPSVVTSKTMDGIYSEVQEDHRALVQLGEGENADFILPCWKEIENYAVDYGSDVVEDAEEDGTVQEETEEDYYEYTDESPRGGVLTMTASDDRIDMKSYDETKDAVERCPVIGGYIYAVTDTDNVISVKLTK